MRKIFFLLTLLSSILTSSAQDYRDVVFLKNGSVIKGFYNELYPTDTLRMETIDGGLLVCPMSDVARIAKERTDIYVVKEQTEVNRIWRPKGYQGSVKLTYTNNLKNNRLSSYGIATIHGYRFNQHLFAGLGLGLEKEAMSAEVNGTAVIVEKENYNFNFFFDGRYYLLKTRTTPYLETNVGYDTGDKAFFFTGTLGVDIGFTPRTGICIGVGYQYYKMDERYDLLAVSLAFHF